ncbi:MAG: penicillin acylase family protein, partial [Mycobacterium sp.]
MKRAGLVVSVVLLSAVLAGCGSSSKVDLGSGGGSGSSSGSGNSGGSTGGGSSGASSNDGSSIYLNIVPPGSNGNSAGGLGLQGNVASYPPNFDDQDILYGDLSYAKSPLVATPCNPPTSITQHVTASNQACNYFKHEGLTPDTVASTETITAPSGDTVTITRDGWGVPFIDAPNRSDAMYGVGYANAEDRLWLDDILRHVGRGMVTAFLGDAPGITSFDSDLAVTTGYSDQELTNIVNATVKQLGPLGPLFLDDSTQFVAGINAYIATLSGKNALKLPPEYASLKLPTVPVSGLAIAPFNVDDVVASAILIQSIFATGGGGEVTNEQLLRTLDPGLSNGGTIPTEACEMWRDLRAANDPEAPVTIDTTFATESPATLNETCPQALPAATVIWDAGSLQARSPLMVGSLSIPATLTGVPGLLESILPGLQGLFPGASQPGQSSDAT